MPGPTETRMPIALSLRQFRVMARLRCNLCIYNEM